MQFFLYVRIRYYVLQIDDADKNVFMQFRYIIAPTGDMSNTLPKSLFKVHRHLLVSPLIRYMSSRNMTGPVQSSVESKLKAALDPIHLEVINESHMHNV